MRSLKLIALAALALLAFGAVGTTVAGAVEAEEEGKPQILCFVAGCINETLKIPLAGGTGSLETLGGLTLTSTSVSATLEKCEALGTNTKDGNLCKDIDLLFLGVKKGEQLCHTEPLSAEKGEVLALLDLHLSAELTAAKVLQPLLLVKILNKELKPELSVKCGVVSTIWRGALGCLLSPGLTTIKTTGEVSLTCKLNKTTHDLETGTCNVLCTENEKEPFEIKFSQNFEDAWLEFSAKGKPNKEVFIDD